MIEALDNVSIKSTVKASVDYFQMPQFYWQTFIVDPRSRVFASRNLTPKSNCCRIEGLDLLCICMSHSLTCTSSLPTYFLDEENSIE